MYFFIKFGEQKLKALILLTLRKSWWNREGQHTIPSGIKHT